MYMYISSFENRVVRFKSGTQGCHCVKTKEALIVCVYEDPVLHEQAAVVTEKLGEYLTKQGF